MARKLLETRVLTLAAPAYLDRYGVPLTPHDLPRHETILFRLPIFPSLEVLTERRGVWTLRYLGGW